MDKILCSANGKTLLESKFTDISQVCMKRES